jgi:hypothetical protein
MIELHARSVSTIMLEQFEHKKLKLSRYLFNELIGYSEIKTVLCI